VWTAHLLHLPADAPSNHRAADHRVRDVSSLMMKTLSTVVNPLLRRVLFAVTRPPRRFDCHGQSDRSARARRRMGSIFMR
jgi:hypothetical protein